MPSRTPKGKHNLQWLKDNVTKEEFAKDYCGEDALTKEELITKYNTTCWEPISRFITFLQVKRSLKFSQKQAKATNLKKYGAEHPSQNVAVKAKRKATNIERFGTAYASQNKDVRAKMSKTNSSPEVRAKTEQTNITKYGTRVSSQNEDVRKKISEALHDDTVKNKIKTTNLEKFGVENAMQNKTVQDKQKATCVERFGVESAIRSPEIQEKTRQTNLKNFGYEYTFNSPEIREKIKQTNLKRFGVENASQSPKIQEKIRQIKQTPEYHEKVKATNREKYGADYYVQSEYCRSMNKGMHSKPNETFESLLDAKNIIHTREFPINNYSFDFKICDILIEINPIGTHNSVFGYRKKYNPLSSDYHLNKSQCAWANGFHCVHVWDWDDLNQIIEQLTCTQSGINLTNINNKYVIKKGTLCMEFEETSPKVFKAQTSLIFTKEFINYFISNIDVDELTIVSDNCKSNPIDFKDLGFELINTTDPIGHWAHLSRHKLLDDDSLINREELIKNKYVEIFDCGFSTWKYKKIES